MSNSYVEDSLDEDDSVDDISHTDDEVTDMVQPVTIVQPRQDIFISILKRVKYMNHFITFVFNDK